MVGDNRQSSAGTVQTTECMKCHAEIKYVGARPSLCRACMPLPPPLIHQATGLAKTVIDVVNGVVHGDNPLVSVEVRNERLGICYVCDQYEKVSGRCFSLPRSPGCGCKMKVKSILSAGKCPKGKW